MKRNRKLINMYLSLLLILVLMILLQGCDVNTINDVQCLEKSRVKIGDEYEVDESYSYDIEFEGMEGCRFISAYGTNGEGLDFFLIDEDSYVVYKFPVDCHMYSTKVHDIAFADVNYDNLLDVITITSDVTGIGSMGDYRHVYVDVYIRDDDKFVHDDELESYAFNYGHGEMKSILEAIEEYQKSNRNIINTNKEKKEYRARLQNYRADIWAEYIIDKEHSYNVEFDGIEGDKFVPVTYVEYDERRVHEQLGFFLVDKDGYITYEFPYYNDYKNDLEIEDVTFKDINKDNYIDIIVKTKFSSEDAMPNNNQEIIYLRKNDRFICNISEDYEIDENHSYEIKLEGMDGCKFISALGESGQVLNFFLVDEDNYITYSFPRTNDKSEDLHVRDISFEDVNNDNLLDVIAITSCYALGCPDDMSYNVNVYVREDGEFKQEYDIENYIMKYRDHYLMEKVLKHIDEYNISKLNENDSCKDEKVCNTKKQNEKSTICDEYDEYIIDEEHSYNIEFDGIEGSKFVSITGTVENTHIRWAGQIGFLLVDEDGNITYKFPYYSDNKRYLEIDDVIFKDLNGDKCTDILVKTKYYPNYDDTAITYEIRYLNKNDKFICNMSEDYEIDEKHSCDNKFEGMDGCRFVSAFRDSGKTLDFFLLDENSYITYKFPIFLYACENLQLLDVAFEDVNKDNLLDVIIVTSEKDQWDVFPDGIRYNVDIAIRSNDKFETGGCYLDNYIREHTDSYLMEDILKCIDEYQKEGNKIK